MLRSANNLVEQRQLQWQLHHFTWRRLRARDRLAVRAFSQRCHSLLLLSFLSI
jgi:hypothetical protein